MLINTKVKKKKKTKGEVICAYSSVVICWHQGGIITADLSWNNHFITYINTQVPADNIQHTPGVLWPVMQI